MYYMQLKGLGPAAWDEIVKALEFLEDIFNDCVGLLTTSPEDFHNGDIWAIIKEIYGVLGTIGTALLVLFFVAGAIKTCGSIAELKRPEAAVRMFIRCAIAKALVDNSLDVVKYIISVVQSIISDIFAYMPSPQTVPSFAYSPDAPVTYLSLDPGDFADDFAALAPLDAIPVYLVCLISHIVLVVIALIIVLTVYGRFFRIFMYVAISPLPLATIAGQPTESIGFHFLKSFVGVCLQGAIITLAFIIFSVFIKDIPELKSIEISDIWEYVTQLIFCMLILLGVVKGSDRITHEMLGL